MSNTEILWQATQNLDEKLVRLAAPGNESAVLPAKRRWGAKSWAAVAAAFVFMFLLTGVWLTGIGQASVSKETVTLSLQPTDDNTVSPLYPGLAWGMSREEVMEQMDKECLVSMAPLGGLTQEEYTQILKELHVDALSFGSEENTLTYRFTAKNRPYVLCGCRVGGLVFQFEPAVTVDGVTYAGGLYGVSVSFLQQNASLSPVGTALQEQYGAGEFCPDKTICYQYTEPLLCTTAQRFAMDLLNCTDPAQQADLLARLHAARQQPEEPMDYGYIRAGVRQTPYTLTVTSYENRIANAQKLLNAMP